MQKEEQLSLFPVGRKYWWLNDESLAVLNRGYLLHGETVEDAVKRITIRASEVLKKPELQPIFEEMIANGWLSLSSPIWANMGTKRGINIACFGSYVTDEIEGITDKLSEVIMQTKIGGGTSGYFGELRGRGASITNNGNSSGAVSFMELFNTAMNVVSQGNTRRGSFAAYLDIDHPDIEEFLQIKDVGHPIQNLFYAVCVSDYWLHEMINGDSKKRDLWAKVLESRQHKGLPYIFFTDNVNKGKPEIYKYLDMKIHSSNLCVAGDTKIMVRRKYNDVYVSLIENIENVIKDFEKGKEIFISSYNKNSDKKEYKKVIKVFRQGIKTTKKYCLYLESKSENGEKHRYEYKNTSFRCTPDHKILCTNGSENFYAEAQDIVKHNYCILSSEIYTNYSLRVMNETPELLGLIDLDEDREEEVYDITVEDNHNFNIYNNRYIITLSNCSEIALPTSKDESFVCCLAAMNLELYDEWKDTKAVQYAIWFLDAVLSDFIENTKDQKHLQTARNFAIRHRAIGLGTLGLASYYQKIGRPFGHPLNIGLNNAIFSHIRSEAEKASRDLAREYGVAPIFKEVGPDFPESEKKRNTTLMTIMPTTSSSAILGQVSPGIEPYSSNYYKVDLAKGNFIRKNKYLKELLKSKGKDNDEVWSDIMIHQGSVQHLDFLTQDEKDIFKTFKEISQYDIIQQAATRQKHIDQSQSLNLNIPPSIPVKEVNKLILEAWKLGVKTLYYQRSQSVAKDLLTNLVTCSGCES